MKSKQNNKYKIIQGQAFSAIVELLLATLECLGLGPTPPSDSSFLQSVLLAAVGGGLRSCALIWKNPDRPGMGEWMELWLLVQPRPAPATEDFLVGVG